MILERDAHTGFSEVLLGRKAREANEPVSLDAALIAHGTDMDATNVAPMYLEPIQGVDGAPTLCACARGGSPSADVSENSVRSNVRSHADPVSDEKRLCQ
jgi:hypothetical protein